jgi:putative transposase
VLHKRDDCSKDLTLSCALIAVTDGLKGIPETLGAVFHETTLQTCIVHLIRNSLDFASWQDRRPLAWALKPIYTAPNAEAAAMDELSSAHGVRGSPRWWPHGARPGIV